MNGNGSIAYVYKKMNVSVASMNGNGRVFNFDLKARNEKKITFPHFFLDSFRIEVKPDGKARIVRYDESRALYPTGALKRIARHLQDNGATTLGYDMPDGVRSLERSGIPQGKDVSLDVWKANLPKSESVLALVDDGK